MIIWQGPSQIDGKPIVLIASGLESDSPNTKTGAMVQCYILRADQSPIEAVRSGADRSICGDCRHRGELGKGRSCYVTLMHGPRVVWDAFQRDVYPEVSLFEAQTAFRARRVRMGAYGDPAAIPFYVWATILLFTDKVTGYTHQWRNCDRQFANYVMASCDTELEKSEANQMGYRTFRVRGAGEQLAQREIICPASEEMGHKTNCFTCGACGGHDSKARVDIAIIAHGAGKSHFLNA